jgi:putative hemolysin
MSKTTLIIFIFSISINTFAAETAKQKFPSPPAVKENEITVFIEDKYKIFQIKKENEVVFTKDCLDKKKTCLAYQATEKAIPLPGPKAPGLGMPAADYCDAKGGRNLIAFDNKRDEVNYCFFKDGTAVGSWSMYFKHYPAKVIR